MGRFLYNRCSGDHPSYQISAVRKRKRKRRQKATNTNRQRWGLRVISRDCGAFETLRENITYLQRITGGRYLNEKQVPPVLYLRYTSIYLKA